MQSLRLSAAVASRAVEPMRLPRVRLNRAIHSFTAMEAISTPATAGVKSTGLGEKIRARELFTSSRPMNRISTATARPLKYSARAWP